MSSLAELAAVSMSAKPAVVPAAFGHVDGPVVAATAVSMPHSALAAAASEPGKAVPAQVAGRAAPQSVADSRPAGGSVG